MFLPRFLGEYYVGSNGELGKWGKFFLRGMRILEINVREADVYLSLSMCLFQGL